MGDRLPIVSENQKLDMEYQDLSIKLSMVRDEGDSD